MSVPLTHGIVWLCNGRFRNLLEDTQFSFYSRMPLFSPSTCDCAHKFSSISYLMLQRMELIDVWLCVLVSMWDVWQVCMIHLKCRPQQQQKTIESISVEIDLPLNDAKENTCDNHDRWMDIVFLLWEEWWGGVGWIESLLKEDSVGYFCFFTLI